MSPDRREFLSTTAIAVGAVSVAAGCTNTERPSPVTPAPSTPAAQPAQCISLSDHRFERVSLCGGQVEEGGQGEGDRIQRVYFGEIQLTETSLIGYYLNALCEWDLQTLQLTRLLAPQRADGWAFAVSDRYAVNFRCDSTLTVHVNGCLEFELPGHVRSDDSWPIRALVPLGSSRVASLGADGTIRLWDLAAKRELTSMELPPTGSGSGAEWSLSLDVGSSDLLASALDGSHLLVLDPETLAQKEEFTDMPATVAGWIRLSADLFVGASPDLGTGAMVVRPGTGVVRKLVTRRVPSAVARSTAGAVAVGDHSRILLYEGNVATDAEPRELTAGMSECTSLRFSPDGKVLYIGDSSVGPIRYDLASKENKKFQFPGRAR